ncbi:MAG: ABC transporter ATP-binding protein [Planctomycetota bacterium]
MNFPEPSEPFGPPRHAVSGTVVGQGDPRAIGSVERAPDAVPMGGGNSKSAIDETVADRVIELRDLVKDYGPVGRRVRALNGITMRMGHGITGLLGPNGAGKTTLIKVLLGLVRVSSGTGTVLGFDLARQARSIRQNVGFMPEDDCYIAGLSGVEMVQFAARLSGLPRTEALRRAHEILDFCGVEQERYRTVDTYSTGMRQKIKFAQAIVHDPPLLILDEPTAGLDPDERVGMLHRVELLARRAGKAVLISTHILPDVRAICGTVVIVAAGQVRVIDSLEALSQPASPAMHVRTATDPAPLIERIRRGGGTVSVQDAGILRVVVDQEDTAEMVWRWARETNVGIRSLTRSRNSLEQIFMDAVRGDDRADP